jgi:hypothetical protein
MAPRFLLVCLVSCVVATSTQASPPDPGDLQSFLAGRFRQGRGVFGAIASLVPGKLDPGSIAGMVGPKPDGSYWTSAWFNRSNVVTFAEPRNALAKFCGSSGGTLQRVRAFDLTRPQGGRAGFSLRDERGLYAVTDDLIESLTLSAPDRSFAGGVGAFGEYRSDLAASVDARGVLGVFSCTAGNTTPIWSVAILPTTAGAWDYIARPEQYSGDAAVMLSVRQVDRALIERMQTASQSAQQRQSVAEVVAGTAAAQRQARIDARVARELSALQAYQAGAKVGDDTSCGLVLSTSGPLVEVQPPDTVRFANGASRLFVKRTMLSPKRSPYPCYAYDLLDGRSSLAISPEEAMRR